MSAPVTSSGDAPSRTESDAAVGEIAREAARKRAARAKPAREIWFGLGMFGLVGWSVAAPAVLGVALGAWLDRAFPSDFSWTLALMLAGVTVGCWNAWRWVSRESRHD